MDHPTEILGNEQRVLARMMSGTYSCEDVGDWIGPYRLIERLGEGGFGIVWRAEQTEPIQREVALKVLKRGMDTAQVLARFDHERQALANMEHPCIAAMIEAGASVDGQPYFAMELVPGQTITQWCERHRSPIHERLRLFNQVCYAVNHAHQKGVIHRDLKPSNILVTSFDSLPTPKIIDFGIAKAIRATTLAEITMLTLADQMIGTPLYMSPEQINGGLAVDTRSDIYALGVLLYELLAGVPPFVSGTSQGSSLDDLKRSIIENNPPRPGTLMRTLKRLEGEAPAISPPFDTSMPNYSVDLDWIVFHAMRKRPEDRYQIVMELAEDVSRFLAREPIHARPPKFGYIAGRWIRRHRTMFIASCAVVAAMFTGTIVSLWQASVAKTALARAEAQTEIARAAEARAAENEIRATMEASRAKKSASFVTDLLDRVTSEIDHGRNPEALKLALADSQERIETLDTDPDLQFQLLNRVATIYKRIGETKPMIPLLKAAAEISAKMNGAASDDAFKAELDYLTMLIDHGNRITAPPLVRDLRERVANAGGRGSKLWFDVHRQLIRTHFKLKQPQAALAAAEESLAELAKHRKPAKSRLIITLATVQGFEIAGQFARAKELTEQCVALNEEVRDDELTYQILKQRVHLYWSQEDFAGGAALLRTIVSDLKTKHGAQSPEVISKLIELVDYELDALEYKEALTHSREAHAIASRPSASREDLARSLLSLAKSNGCIGCFDQAIAHAEEALAISRELGKPSTIQDSLEILAILHDNANRPDEAVSYFLQYQRHLEAEHANYRTPLEVMEEICSIRVRQGRIDEAMNLAVEVWNRLLQEPESGSEPAFVSEIAHQCLTAHTAWRALNPAVPASPHLSSWLEAAESAEPSENVFSRLRKRRSGKSQTGG